MSYSRNPKKDIIKVGLSWK